MTIDITEPQEFTYKGHQNCLMACAIGFGSQPVLCNIIGSEPLFYIEEQYDFEDELFLESSIDEDFFSLQETNPERLERLRAACAHVESDRVVKTSDLFEQDLELLNHKEDLPVLTKQFILEQTEKSGSLTSSIQFLKQNNIDICLSASVEYAMYDRVQSSIIVNPYQTIEQAMVHLARAVRMAEHHKSGILVHPLFFDPEEAVLINRVIEADLAIHTLRTAWDLKLAGYEQAWQEMISGSAYDIASAFAREAVADFRSLTDGRANRAAFEQWFLSSRCKASDRDIIQTMLADHHGYVFDNNHFTKNLTKDILARLGDSQVGDNYLTSILDQVLTDPLYNEIRDRSNANFLWFIKFERSFRDSEEALQEATSSEQSATGKETEIIRMADHRPMGSTRSPKKTTTGSNSQDGATIYYINHFVGLH